MKLINTIVLYFSLVVMLYSQSGLKYFYETENPSSNYLLENWDIKNGLSQSSVWEIVQGRDDFLYLATFNGLTRFDGVKFTQMYENIPELKNMRRIRALYLDSKNRMWIVVENKVGYINQNKFVELNFDDLPEFNNIFGIIENEDGQILFVNRYNIFAFDTAKFEINKVPLNVPGLVFFKCTSLNNKIYIGTGDGLYTYENDELVKVNTGVKYPILSTTNLSNNRLGFSEGVHFYILENGKTQKFKLDCADNDFIISLFEDSKKQIWIGTHLGKIFIIKNSKIYRFFDERDFGGVISTFKEDKEGNIWIGSITKGLFKAKIRKIKLLNTVLGTNGDPYYPIHEDKHGNIIIGVSCGNLIVVGKNEVKHIDLGEYGANACTWAIEGNYPEDLWLGSYGGALTHITGDKGKRYSMEDGVVGDEVFALYTLRDTMWVGTSIGASIYVNNKFEVIENLREYNIKCFLNDSKNRLWVGTTNGLLLRENNNFVNVSEKYNIVDENIRCLYEDSLGTVWIGSYGSGLSYINDHASGTITTENGIEDDIIHALMEDEYGFIWMSSNTGLFKVTKVDLYGIIEGRIDKINSFKYGFYDGLTSIECNGGHQKAVHKTSDGLICFPTINGLAVVNSNDFSSSALVPKIYIDEVYLDGKKVTHDGLITVPPDFESLEITYTALSLYSSQKVLFRTKFEGLDQDWSEASSSRSLKIRNMHSGQYEFKVIATNNDGIWNYDAASLTFNFEEHIYERISFYIVIFFVIVLLIAFIVFFRIKSLVEKEKELEEVVKHRTQKLNVEKKKVEELFDNAESAKKLLEEKHKQLLKISEEKDEFVRIITHNLKNPIATIKGAAELMDSNLHDSIMIGDLAGVIKSSSTNMLNSINKLLQFSKLEQLDRKFTLNEVKIVDLVEGIVLSNKVYTKSKNQKLIFLNSLDKNLVINADRENLSSAIDNYVNNAIKYSALNTDIIVNLFNENGFIRFEVKDQGPGISEEDKVKLFKSFQRVSSRPTGGESSSGLGLAIVKKIIERHEGKVGVISDGENGSTFWFELPENHIVTD